MNDARCFELYSVRGMQRKDVAQAMGVSVEEVRRALARHAAAQRKKAAEDRKVLLRESRERRVFEKQFPNAPAEWWPVWLARSMVKP